MSRVRRLSPRELNRATLEQTKRDEALLSVTPFTKVTAAVRRDVEAEAERLVRFVEPDAARHGVAWAPAG